MARTLVFADTLGPWGGASSSRVRCALISTSQIQCQRTGVADSVVVYWQTLEHRLLDVQRAQVTCSTTTSSATLATAVTPTNSFVVGSYQAGGISTAFNGNDVVSAHLSNATTVTVDFGACGQANNIASLQVAQMPGISVSRGTLSNILGLSASVPASALAARDGGAFVNYSYVISSATTECESSVRAADGVAGLTFTRGRGNIACLTSGIDSLNYEYVDFGPLAHAQQVNTALGNNATSAVTAIAAVDAERSIVLTGHNLGLGGIGETSPTTSSTGPSSGIGIHSLSADGGTVGVLRTGSIDAAWTAWVLTFEP
jgi:hypothetical protein